MQLHTIMVYVLVEPRKSPALNSPILASLPLPANHGRRHEGHRVAAIGFSQAHVLIVWLRISHLSFPDGSNHMLLSATLHLDLSPSGFAIFLLHVS
ncbi:hypothetical protein TgHK011_008661 [Trichoderma gracile]|nr:hypothetical protein TgHK011_008661 [Trichoderma gracile]